MILSVFCLMAPEIRASALSFADASTAASRTEAVLAAAAISRILI
jgi:hypothetical protein